VTLPIMLDTGSDGEFTIGAEALEQLPGPARKLTTLAVAGGGGIEVETIVELPSLDIGALSQGRTQVTAANRGGYLVKAGVPALVGMGVLGRYDFVLDGPLKRLLLRPRQNKPPQAPRSTVGVQGAYKSDRIAIIHVMANSPAEKAGLRAGDEICSVDGQKVVNGWTQSPMRDWGTRPAGQTHWITLCSGRSVAVVSAAFY
jgi:membrane-associated protease RseP (regulator of RpoE activity)